MADKKNTSKRQTTASKSARSATKVTIKKASETKETESKAAEKSAASKRPVKKVQSTAKNRRLKWPRFLVAIGSYFKGAWFELRQVRWPDRKATWGLTLAVILFSVFFAALILGLDYVFQLLFKNILL